MKSYIQHLFVPVLLLLLLLQQPIHAQHNHMQMAQPAMRDTTIYTTQPGNQPKKVVYNLDITDTSVQYTQKHRPALAVNGSIPAPVLYFTEGDTAWIYVHNKSKQPTSIHWHGLVLPNEQDGVPYLTTRPIAPGETHVYAFPIVQSGTYWYHSHMAFQQQNGLYGAIVIYKRSEQDKATRMKDYTMLLSDWTDEKPEQVDRRLHNATEWYQIKKHSTQNYGEAIVKGHLGTKLTNEWKRMTAMDVSDVAYDKFLVNGEQQHTMRNVKAGDKIKLHIVNGSSSTYFWLQYAGSKITVVANDGMDVVPIEVDRLIIAVAETYDVVVTVPQNMQYEFRATSEDRTGTTSLWLGDGMKMAAPVMPRLDYFEGMKMMNGMMDMSGNMNDMGMQMSNQQMDMNMVMYPELQSSNTQGMTHDSSHMDMKDMPGMNMPLNSSTGLVTLNYGMLRSPVKTTLPEGPFTELKFNLTGNMNRYVWTINNKTVSETDYIKIHKGENIRIILYNNTMMRHPMHLHGHFFRVLNGNGEYSPLKNTLDIMPMETDTLEFRGDATGDWYFHCHILYHMMSGMGRIFEYEDGPANTEVPDREMAKHMTYMDDRMVHAAAKVGLESNGTDGEAALSNTRWQLRTEWRLGLNNNSGYESETHIGRYLGRMQFWQPYIGFDYHYRKLHEHDKNLFGQINTKNDRAVLCAGIQYILPLFITADARVDMHGKLRFQLGREGVPLTSRLRLNFMANTDREYMAGLQYIITKTFSLSTHYDSDMGWGGGITLVY